MQLHETRVNARTMDASYQENSGSYRATRRERYDTKLITSIQYPISIVTINFLSDENLAFVIRSAVCFGAQSVKVIGGIPNRNKLYNKSGSTLDYINIEQYLSIEDYISKIEQQTKVVCAEICDNAISLFNYRFDFNHHTDIVVGNETIGVSGVLTEKFETVYIPMTAVGYCLNTAQTANIMLYEYVRQLRTKD